MKISVQKVTDQLTIEGFTGGPIFFKGAKIGSFVTHGDKTPQRNTVYASRIYQGPVRIEVTGKRRDTMLAKVAKELAKAINGGFWPLE